MKDKKDAVVNNKKTGGTRKSIQFDTILSCIAANDDSIEPEFTVDSSGDMNYGKCKGKFWISSILIGI